MSTDVLVTSSGRGCLSGLHVACLAAGFSRRGVDVGVYEMSGVLPNTSFYLGHPPSVYLARGGTRRQFHAALGGIFVAFDPSVSPPGRHGTGRLRLFHLPPVRPPDALQAALAPLGAGTDGRRWVLVLYDGDCPPVAGVPGLGERGRFTLSLRGPSGDGRTEGHLGSLDGWAHRANDRLPCVIRDPRWALSRDYQAICDSMLNRIGRAERRKDGAPLTGAPAGHQSGR